jgi:hypothetical protein
MSISNLLPAVASATLRKHGRVVIAAVLFYALLAGILVWLGRNRLNTDAISYIQVARHFFEGNSALAINSWWSPIFSWLLIPGLALGIDPVIWARALQGIAGVVFAHASAGLFRRCQGEAGTLLVFILGLCAALVMQTLPLSPDLCHACILTWYFSAAYSLFLGKGLRAAVLTGVLGGVSYLMKAYSLPFIVVHLAATFLLNRCWRDGRLPFPHALVQWGTAVLLVIGISSPWILFISRHDRELTISSAGRYWTVAQPIDPQEMAPLNRLMAVPPGRLTVLEDIRSLPLEWSPAPPFAGWRAWKNQLKSTRHNVREIFSALNQIDGIGLTQALLLTAVILSVPFRKATQHPGRLFASWALLSLAIYLCGYALIYFEPRLLWAMWGLILVLGVAALNSVPLLFPSAEKSPRTGDLTTFQRWQGGILLALAGLILFNAAANVAAHLTGNAYRLEAELRRAAGKLPSGQVLAANDWGSGLCFAYWNYGRFLGIPTSTTPEKIANELRPFGPCVFTVIQAPEVAKALGLHAAFHRIELASPWVEAFEFKPSQIGN